MFRPAPARPAETAAPARQPVSADETAIRSAVDAFTKAYNAGDARAVAAQFGENAEILSADGMRHDGRDEIEHLFAATFAANPGIRIAIAIDSLRVPAPGVVLEEGSVTITPTDAAPMHRRATVLYVKRADQWLFDSVREEEDRKIRPHDRLKELEWMLGEWVDQGSEAEVHASCRWSEDGNFLLREFVVKIGGSPAMTVSQRVGWDALTRHIKSWEFDSEGGHGEGIWTRDGKRWIIKQSGVDAEGQLASATRILAPETSNRVTWAHFHQIVGGRLVPDVENLVLVRTPPKPRDRTRAITPNPPKEPR